MYKEYNINQIVLPLVLTLKIDQKILLLRSCTRAKGNHLRQIQKNINWEYFKHFIQEHLQEKTQKKS